MFQRRGEYLRVTDFKHENFPTSVQRSTLVCNFKVSMFRSVGLQSKALARDLSLGFARDFRWPPKQALPQI